MTMGKRLERFGEVRTIAETHGFEMDFVKKAESGIRVFIYVWLSVAKCG